MAEEDFVDYEEDDQQVGAVSSSKDTKKYVPSHAQLQLLSPSPWFATTTGRVIQPRKID
jgi:hypothetical protein